MTSLSLVDPPSYADLNPLVERLTAKILADDTDGSTYRAEEYVRMAAVSSVWVAPREARPPGWWWVYFHVLAGTIHTCDEVECNPAAAAEWATDAVMALT